MPWLHHVEAVLQAWYPGQQFGAALASVLFGDSDPGGRLPVTFPAERRAGAGPTTRPERYPGVNGEQRYDEGILVGYRWYDQFRQRPLFPFGYGLSYADFRFGDVRVRVDHGGVTASTRVTNTSRRAGSTVAQAYLSFPRSAGEPPRQLKGYEKVQLGPGRARSSPSGSTAPTWPTSTSTRTARSSPTGATRCPSGARRATCPRARASSWAATGTESEWPRLGSGAVSTTGRERGGYAKGRERRDAILAAANEVFATRGFRGASLATIAKRVGMSEPGLLHHFASKEELLLELLKLRDQHDDERIAQARAAHAHVPGRPARAVPPERGAARHRAALHDPRGRERRRRPPRPRLVPRPLPRAPARPGRAARRRAARGHASTPTSTPRSVASQILAMFDGLQIQWLLDPGRGRHGRGVRGFSRAVAAALGASAGAAALRGVTAASRGSRVAAVASACGRPRRRGMRPCSAYVSSVAPLSWRGLLLPSAVTLPAPRSTHQPTADDLPRHLNHKRRRRDQRLRHHAVALGLAQARRGPPRPRRARRARSAGGGPRSRRRPRLEAERAARSRSPSTMVSIERSGSPIAVGHHLAGELRAGGERAQEEVARAGRPTRAADAGVGLGLGDRVAEVDRAGHRRVGRAPRADRVIRAAGVGPVARP